MMAYGDDELRDRIALALDEAGLSTGQAERALGWKPGSLRGFMTGHIRVITGDLLEHLAAVCGVRFRWLALNETPPEVRASVARVCTLAVAKGLRAGDVKKLETTLLIMEGERP